MPRLVYKYAPPGIQICPAWYKNMPGLVYKYALPGIQICPACYTNMPCLVYKWNVEQENPTLILEDYVK
jgi:hypothetical protein